MRPASLMGALLCAALVGIFLVVFLFLQPAQENPSPRTETVSAEPEPSVPANRPPSALPVPEDRIDREEMGRTPVAAPARVPRAESGKSLTIEGSVRDSSKRPIDEVEVRLLRVPAFRLEIHEEAGRDPRPQREDEIAKTKADAAGAFVFENVVPPRDESLSPEYELRFSRPGYASAVFLVGSLGDTGSALRLAPFTLFREAKISGRVSFSSSSSELASVQGVPTEWFHRIEPPKATVAADGRYEISGIPPGKWSFRAAAKGFRLSDVQEIELQEGEIRSQIDFALQEGLAIRGRVISRSGEPVSGAKISLSQTFQNLHEMKVGSIPWLPPSSPTTPILSGADGSFVAAGLNPGEYSIRVRADGYAEGLRSQIRSGDSNVEMVLGKRGAILGRVVDAKTGSALEKGAVHVRRERDVFFFGGKTEAPRGVGTDAEGLFRIEGLDPGRYAVNVTQKGYAPFEREGVIVSESGETQMGNLLLERGATLRVHAVAGASREPVRGGSVRLEALDAERSGVEFRRKIVVGGPRSGSDAITSEIGEDGSATFHNLNPGSYRVRAESPSLAPSSQDLVLGPDEEKTVEFVLSEGASLCGRTFAPTGPPIPSRASSCKEPTDRSFKPNRI